MFKQMTSLRGGVQLQIFSVRLHFVASIDVQTDKASRSQLQANCKVLITEHMAIHLSHERHIINMLILRTDITYNYKIHI